jgi:hypothetical protein
MLTNVLPGLRELRAPLAAGYLWLVFAWMVWGGELPNKDDPKAAPLEQLYKLEPIISTIGLAVVASVAAYVLGSIVIDVQTAIGRGAAQLSVRGWLLVVASLSLVAAIIFAWRRLDVSTASAVTALVGMVWIGSFGRPWYMTRGLATPYWTRFRPTGQLALTEAGSSMLERWERNRVEELRAEFDVDDPAVAKEIEAIDDEDLRQDLVSALESGLTRRSAKRPGTTSPPTATCSRHV